MKIEIIGLPTLCRDYGTRHPDARDDQDIGTDAERIIERAGRVCYDSWGKGRSSAEFHRNVLEVRHMNLLRHVQWTFDVSGVSRSMTLESNRHHVGTAISQRSTRYCDESDGETNDHPLFKLLNGQAHDLAFTARAAAFEAYNAVVEEGEATLIELGADRLTARKQARAAGARYLPAGLETELVWSANAEALRNIITMRATDAADAEIREWACELWRLMVVECPAYFQGRLVPAQDGLGSVVVWVTT